MCENTETIFELEIYRLTRLKFEVVFSSTKLGFDAARGTFGPLRGRLDNASLFIASNTYKPNIKSKSIIIP